MANRYWVGGNGVWSTSNTANWSATSGGAGGVSVPTSADNVFIDANSGATSVQLADGQSLACANFTVTKSGLTIAYQTVTSSTLACYGSWSLLAGTTWTARTALSFKATTTGKTVSFNGCSLPGGAYVTFDGVGGGWTLGSALTITEVLNISLYFLNGSFNSGNYTITCTGFATDGTGTRSITLGSSTVNSTAAGIRFNSVTGLTFSGASAIFNISTSTVFIGGGQTFGTVNYLTNSSTLTISGNNTFSTFATSGTNQTLTFTSGSTQSIYDFNVSGTAGNLNTINSTTPGSPATITNASAGLIRSLNYVSIKDSTAAGFAIWRALNSTNVSGNSGWTFANNRYWVGGAGTWDTTTTTNWSATSGGTGGASAPTLNDNVYFDANSGAGTCTMSGSLSCFDLSFAGDGLVNTLTGLPPTASWYTGTLTGGTALTVYGNFIRSDTMTWTTAPATINFSTSAYNRSIYITDALATTFSTVNFSGTFTGSYVLVGGYFSGASITLSGGFLEVYGGSSYLYCTNLTVSGATYKSLTLNSVTHYVNGNLSFNGATNFSFTPNNSEIYIVGNLTGISTTVSTTFYNVFLGSTTTGSTLSGLLIFNNLKIRTTANNTIYKTVTFDTSPLTINGQFSTESNVTYLASSRVRLLHSTASAVVSGHVICNGTTNLTSIDFRNVYVTGTAAPISGTSIGNLGGCNGITFSTPKTVYWGSSLSTGAWNSLGWSLTSGGTASYNAFPLPQDTAIFNNSSGVGGSLSTINMYSLFGWVSTVDMSSRTASMTAQISGSTIIYGDWINGSGTTLSGTSTLTFSKDGTQTITSLSKTFTCGLTIDGYLADIQLADALNIGSQTLTVTRGTFTTNGYSVTAGSLSSSNSNVRAINLGASTVTIGQSTGLAFTNITNMTFSAGTSTMVFSAAGALFNSGGLIFNNVSFTSTSGGSGIAMNGANTFSNLTYTAPGTSGLITNTYSANQTITGTLTCAGATAVRRIFLRSSTIGTQRTLTVGTLSAQDCDFRDIVIAGAASGSSPTRAGDCGGNSGITFPAAKTVYWNLAGTQNWSATGWCSSSGGTPDINQFPLAQDTATFDDTGSAGSITIEALFNIGTFNSSARTVAANFSVLANSTIYGDWTFGSGINPLTGGVALIDFSKRGIQTITSNGKTFGNTLRVDSVSGTVQLADALSTVSSQGLIILSGTFDAVFYNVTTGYFSTGPLSKTLKMGSGTWTLSGTGPGVWNSFNGPINFFKGTANIVLSDTSTTARTFTGGGLSYNKLTIGGATGTSTTTITGSNQFTELASTKTVAHTIDLGATTQTVGAWTVTGTVGNVVTLTGTSTIIVAGARVSGVNYLALGTTVLSTTSPGEFYAGANSTGGTGFILTAAPAAVTRYWRGGAGTWDATTTTNWSASSGGAGGASVPTSADAVVFDSASNATAYTVTCTATQLRCASLTMAGPAAGNVTWAGTAPLAIHGNVTLAATGITRTYTGAITLTGSATGKTLTTNGVALASATTVNGVGCGWTLGSSLTNTSNSITVTNGSIDFATYNFSGSNITSTSPNSRSISLGTGTIDLTGAFNLGTTNPDTLTFSASSSQVNMSSANASITGNGKTFNSVSFTSATGTGTFTFTGENTFATLSFSGQTIAGIKNISFSANQTITGTLTLSAGTDATMRTFLQSDTIGTTRTLTCAAFSGTDVDFRDITIAGTAAPVSGTRFGDCKGNSGITFGAGVNKYWNLAAGGNWSATGWATTSGGTPAVNNFPLAQDTAIFQSTGLNSGATISLNASYNIGTIDMSLRTSNTMTLAMGTYTGLICGNWINGTGTTLTAGSGGVTFAGRTTQTMTNAGKTFPKLVVVDSPGGSLTMQDAFTTSSTDTASITLTTGTLNANGFNVTTSGGVSSTGTGTRTLAMGSGTRTAAGNNTIWNFATPTNLTLTGTGTITLTSPSTKTFAGGGISYSGITLNQGGSGGLIISGNNTFKNITNSYGSTGATSILLTGTTQTVSQFTATGTSGKLLAILGSSVGIPGTIIYTGSSQTTGIDYLVLTSIAFYVPNLYWYIGTNSTGSFSGAYLLGGTIVSTANGNFFLFF